MGENLDSTKVEIGNKKNKDNHSFSNAKTMGRQASKQMMQGSKKVAKKSKQYTLCSIDSIATALPDSELMILAIMLVTIFTRAEEAHLKSKF